MASTQEPSRDKLDLYGLSARRRSPLLEPCRGETRTVEQPGATRRLMPPLDTKAEQMAAQPVFVLGMHRSGTSALAGMCAQLGVHFGDELMGPAVDNPKGFWERREIADLHDRMLEAVGMAWDHLAPMPASALERIARDESFREGAVTLCEAMSSEPVPWGLKDPRLSRLLPCWTPLLDELDVRPRYLIAVRPAAEVAASLERRNGFAPDKSYLLWLRHVLEAERFTRSSPRSVVPYDTLIGGGHETAERISADLDLDWPRQPADAAVELEIFIDPALRHHDASIDQPHGPTESRLAEWADAAMQALERPGRVDREADDVLDRIAHDIATQDKAVPPLQASVQTHALADTEWRLMGALERIDGLLQELESTGDAVAAGDDSGTSASEGVGG